MPTDKHDMLASVALFNAINNVFRLSAGVRRLDSGPKGKWGLWFSSTPALYLQATGLDLVSFHEFLRFEGRRRECLG